MSEQKQRTATERLTDLEQGYVGLFNSLNGITRELSIIKEAIKLLGNKVDSMVKLSVRGEALNDDNIAKVMIENNEIELKTKVENLKFQGALADADVASEDSFMVAKEVNDSGEVVNPRLQFAIASFADEVKSKLIGSKIGDTVTIEEGKLKLQVTEIYKIQTPPTELPQAQV
jgi:hypothetical protein